MAFSAKPVSAIMHQRARLTFLYEEEQLDALKLDKLYKTGLGCFPVYEGEPEKEPITPKRAMSKEQKPEPPKPILGLFRYSYQLIHWDKVLYILMISLYVLQTY